MLPTGYGGAIAELEAGMDGAAGIDGAIDPDMLGYGIMVGATGEAIEELAGMVGATGVEAQTDEDSAG